MIGSIVRSAVGLGKKNGLLPPRLTRAEALAKKKERKKERDKAERKARGRIREERGKDNYAKEREKDGANEGEHTLERRNRPSPSRARAGHPRSRSQSRSLEAHSPTLSRERRPHAHSNRKAYSRSPSPILASNVGTIDSSENHWDESEDEATDLIQEIAKQLLNTSVRRLLVKTTGRKLPDEKELDLDRIYGLAEKVLHLFRGGEEEANGQEEGRHQHQHERRRHRSDRRSRRDKEREFRGGVTEEGYEDDAGEASIQTVLYDGGGNGRGRSNGEGRRPSRPSPSPSPSPLRHLSPGPRLIPPNTPYHNNRQPPSPTPPVPPHTSTHHRHSQYPSDFRGTTDSNNPLLFKGLEHDLEKFSNMLLATTSAIHNHRQQRQLERGRGKGGNSCTTPDGTLLGDSSSSSVQPEFYDKFVERSGKMQVVIGKALGRIREINGGGIGCWWDV